MKKKVLILILLIPIIFILTLFSFAQAAEVYADVPVSSISIVTPNDNGFIKLDMATYKNDLFLRAEVAPVKAKNKGYGFTVTPLHEGDMPSVSVSEDGLVAILCAGSSKVSAVSANGAYTDSVIIEVYSSKVVSLSPVINDANGEKINIVSQGNGIFSTSVESGGYWFGAEIYPSALSDSHISWKSGDAGVLEINETTGKAKAKLSGEVVITLTAENGINGELKAAINVTVRQKETASGVTVNGEDAPDIYCGSDSTGTSFTVEFKSAQLSVPEISGGGAEWISSYTALPVGNDNKRFMISLEFKSAHPQKLSLAVESGGVKQNFGITFSNYIFDVFTSYHLSGDDKMYQKTGSNVKYVVSSEIQSDSISYVWNISGEGDFSLKPSGNGEYCFISANGGTVDIEVKAYKHGSEIAGATVVKSVAAVKPLYSAAFEENSKTYGIENILAVGDSAVEGSKYISANHKLKLRLRTDSGNENYSENADLLISSSDGDVLNAKGTQNGLELEVRGDGIAVINVSWRYAAYFKTDVGASIKIRAVKGGVETDDYQSLRKAAADGRKIVLNSDIMLGRKGAAAAELNSYAQKMQTTYDWTFYQNSGRQRPEVLYLIEFKNDVYGNGFALNADNITKAEDAAGKPFLFKGPLDFVSMAGAAAVKAQDNIAFLVRTDGVLIDNIVLKGCSDESIINSRGYNMSELNYSGTVLEIAADCTIVNSRVLNGRNVIRAYGGGNDGTLPGEYGSEPNGAVSENDRIKVKIESCVLSGAREFILKIGSNKALIAEGGSADEFTVTTLKRADGTAYSPFDASNASDEYFYENYVTADVTLKNAVLANSGLFSVGIETHFSGVMLAGFNEIKPPAWSRLAATSYAGVLRLAGDVKFLDWKKLNSVDSSTLIETGDYADDYLKLDIPAMLKKVYKTDPKFSDIISVYNSEEYVHGGVAFYGGGINYSYLDTSAFTAEALTDYRINLSVLAKGLEKDIFNPLYLQGTMLPLAAGEGDFRFFLYGGASERGYEWQRNLMSDGQAFAVPAAAV